MKITDSFLSRGVSDKQLVRQRPELRKADASSRSDVGSLSSLARVAVAEATESGTSLRPLSELQAMLKQARSADPSDTAEALLSRGFLPEEN